MTMHGGVCLDADAKPRIIERRSEPKFLDAQVSTLEEGRALGIGLGATRLMFSPGAQRGWRPDIVTEMCPCYDPLSHIPQGYTPESAEAFRKADRLAYLDTARASMKRRLRAMHGFQERGVRVFEYGPGIRKDGGFGQKFSTRTTR